jgi:hypothetical protein
MLFTLPNLFYFIFSNFDKKISVKSGTLWTEFSLFIFRILAKFGTQYYVLQIYNEREGSGYSDAFRGNYNGWE